MKTQYIALFFFKQARPLWYWLIDYTDYIDLDMVVTEWYTYIHALKWVLQFSHIKMYSLFFVQCSLIHNTLELSNRRPDSPDCREIGGGGGTCWLGVETLGVILWNSSWDITLTVRNWPKSICNKGTFNVHERQHASCQLESNHMENTKI